MFDLTYGVSQGFQDGSMFGFIHGIITPSRPANTAAISSCPARASAAITYWSGALNNARRSGVVTIHACARSSAVLALA